MDLNLLEKTELWITNLKLTQADLSEIARIVAHVLEIPSYKVMVVDVGDRYITLDILQKHLQAKQLFGKKKILLETLSRIKGVTIYTETEIHSDGVLGLIALEPEEARQVLENTASITKEITRKLRKRALVFPTGFEVKKGMIKDTNTPYLLKELAQAGYRVKAGEVLDDDVDVIAGRLRFGINEGYGLIVTTGGIGAEDKDKTVEGVLKVDPQAVTPYIMKFTRGQGRHAKDGVRIAVGQVGGTFIISLPGPHDEVKVCLDVILHLLEQGTNKLKLAKKLASVLKAKLQQKLHPIYHSQHHIIPEADFGSRKT